MAGLKLSVDTRTIPDFQTYGTEPGLISVEWKRIPGLETRFNGTTETNGPAGTIRTRGKSTFCPATVTGTVVGFPIPHEASSLFAQIGRYLDTYVQHSFKP